LPPIQLPARNGTSANPISLDDDDNDEDIKPVPEKKESPESNPNPNPAPIPHRPPSPASNFDTVTNEIVAVLTRAPVSMLDDLAHRKIRGAFLDPGKLKYALSLILSLPPPLN
jgi:hypothetical protein